jgi:DNA-binding IclR family transcriptional regulator
MPIRNESSEVVAAVNLSAHQSTISRGAILEALQPHLVVAADRISGCLGCRG